MDLVLAGAVQPGQRVEQLGAQVVLNVEGELAALVAAQVDAGEVHRGRDEEQAGQRPDGLPWVTITLSMICRWISGIAAVAAVANSAPPIAMSTVRR